MMDLDQWKKAVQIHLPAIGLILKNILQHPYEVELKDADTGSNSDAEQQMQKADIVVRLLEKNFNSEIFLGFSEDWSTALAYQLLDETAQKEDVQDTLIVELSSNLTSIITGALAETGMEVEVVSIDKVKEGTLSGSFNLQKYFRSNIQAVPAPENSSGKLPPTLEMWVALSHPNKEQVNEYSQKFADDNPFLDDRYTETLNRFAHHTDMAQDNSSNGEFNTGISMKGKEVEFEDFSNSKSIKNTHEVRNIDILKDVEMHVSVELGSRKMPLGNILQLVKGSVIELEKLAGEPVEILVNGHKIAQGDVVVIDEHFGVRITNLLASRERIKELQ